MIKYLIILFIPIFIGCTDSRKSEQPLKGSTDVQEEGINVTVSVLKVGEFQKQIVANGKVEALQKSELRFKTNDRIARVRIINGQRVSKGQIIANLDNELLRNQLTKAKIELNKAESKFMEERINYGFSNENENDIDPVVLNNLKIKSGFFEAENNVHNAQLLLDQTILRAPFSGIIANLDTNEGNYITSNDVFCSIVNVSKMEVSFSVLEGDLYQVEKGQQVKVTPFAFKNKEYYAKVSEINPLIDENGLIKVKATVENMDETMFDGMNVKVVINKPVHDAMLIPKSALVLRSNREVVFTTRNGVANWNYVDILDENSTHYAIGEGIKPGDTIIVSGNINLSHDAKVSVTFVEETQ